MANAELAERARMFEKRAEKATDPMSRQHYREMAAHYRSLSVEHQDGPSKAAPAAARVSAASALLDRGWGKPPQPHTGEDGDIRVTVRTIIEGRHKD
jgi:hypothetical protein